jgi:predicted esterase
LHQGPPWRRAGSALEDARAAAILVHGRGATAEGILQLVPLLAVPDVAFLAPQAAGNQWYPFPFLAPLEMNQPWLGSALRVLDELLADVGAAGLDRGNTVLMGFSQGACLVLEYAARHPARYGAVVALSGGLIGPDSALRDYTGSLSETPVFIGCSDMDPHIPLSRVKSSAAIMQQLGGRVDLRIYPGMGHTINNDEIAVARRLLQGARMPARSHWERLSDWQDEV